MNGQILWVVALLLYIYDSVSLRDRDVVLRYSFGGVTALLSAPSLKVGSKRLFFGNPLRPDHCDLPLISSDSVNLSTVDQYLIKRASWIYLPHQVVAVAAFVTLFGLTPILATRMNLLASCGITVGITYWLCAFHWIEMWKKRRLLRVDAKAMRSDIFHILLCPPNAANCARSIANRRHSRYGVLPTLKAFSRYDAAKYEEQYLPQRALA